MLHEPTPMCILLLFVLTMSCLLIFDHPVREGVVGGMVNSSRTFPWRPYEGGRGSGNIFVTRAFRMFARHDNVPQNKFPSPLQEASTKYQEQQPVNENVVVC